MKFFARDLPLLAAAMFVLSCAVISTAHAQQGITAPSVTSPSAGDNFKYTLTQGGYMPPSVPATSNHPYSYMNDTGSQISDTFNITFILQHGALKKPDGTYQAAITQTSYNEVDNIIIPAHSGTIGFSHNLTASSVSPLVATYQTTAVSYDLVNHNPDGSLIRLSTSIELSASYP